MPGIFGVDKLSTAVDIFEYLMVFLQHERSTILPYVSLHLGEFNKRVPWDLSETHIRVDHPRADCNRDDAALLLSKSP